MAAYADFDDTYIISAAEMLVARVAAGSRAQAILNALSPLATATQEVPRLMGSDADTYTLAAGANVDSVLAAGGVRGHKFLSVLLAAKGA